MTSLPADVTYECRVFTRFLIDDDPTPYVIDRYTAAHHHLPSLEPGGVFDRRLLRFARRAPWATRVADSYARILAPRTALRHRLVTLLAILETCAPSCRAIDAVQRGGRLRLITTVAGRMLVSLAALLVGVLLITPMRLRPGGDE